MRENATGMRWPAFGGRIEATQATKHSTDIKCHDNLFCQARGNRKEMGNDLTHAKFKKAVDERKDVRAEKRDIKKDEKRLERQGVKHPVTKAKHKIRAEKEEQKAKF